MSSELPADRGIALSFAQITDIGGRPSNQDALGSAQQDELGCFVVSDGAGGHEGGELASNIVVRAVVESFLRELSFGPRALQSYVEHAIVQVAQGKIAEERLSEMSATVAAVLIDKKNRHAIRAHLGDTRVYLFRRHKLLNVTKDHSLVQQFIDAGYCKPDETRTHPQRSVLFAAIGTEGDHRPEVVQEAIDVQDGDVILICTDGLWEWVTEETMEQTLATANNADEWLADLRKLAEKNSNASPKLRDNCTAQALWFNEYEAEAAFNNK